VEEAARADLAAPIDLVLVDGDIQAVVVQEHAGVRELADAVVEQL